MGILSTSATILTMLLGWPVPCSIKHEKSFAVPSGSRRT